MPRRLIVLLLNAAIVLTGVMSGPCAGNATCTMARAQHGDCCSSMKTGISAPRCCRQQLTRGVMATTADRPVPSTLIAAAAHMAPTAIAVPGAQRAMVPPRIDAAVAPPGGTLIAQHTSLLL